MNGKFNFAPTPIKEEQVTPTSYVEKSVDERIAEVKAMMEVEENKNNGWNFVLAMLYNEKAQKEAHPFCNDGYELKPFDWRADLKGKCNDAALLAHRKKYGIGGAK